MLGKMTALTHLECAACGARSEVGQCPGQCSCGGTVVARYDLGLVRESWNRDWIPNGPPTQWRYAPLLPVARPGAIVSLGEGLTPLLRAARLGARYGFSELWIKDEGCNPAGTAAARGFSCALSMARELSIEGVAAAPQAEDAVALAAYAAQAGLRAWIRLPGAAPLKVRQACLALGARIAATPPGAGEWLDLNEFCEPFRLEGAKTAGWEVAEQFRWSLPEAIVCPPGSGLLVAGIWKAVKELEALGWVGPERPRLFAAGGDKLPPLPLRALEESGGRAVEATAAQAQQALRAAAAEEGVLLAPGGGAALAAAANLLGAGELAASDRVVVVNPASGLWFTEWTGWEPQAPEAEKLGGLITPR